MASFTFVSAVDDTVRGNIDFDTDTFYALLTTSTYAPDQDLHTKRSDVTNEVAAGGGYSTGGQAVTVTVTKDTTNNRDRITIAAHSWAASTITARREVIYKRRGGASSADELVAVNDFGADVSSVGAAFNVAQSTLDFSITT